VAEAPRSNRPTPRTTAAIEAELRGGIRAEITQARSEAENGELDDAALSSIIARAVAAAVGWHLEAPEHTRNSTFTSRTWRPAGGPRGGRREEFEERSFEDRGPRSFEDRGPRRFDDRPRRPPFEQRGPYQERPPRDFDDREAPPRRGPRDEDDREFPARRGPPSRPPYAPRGGSRPPSRGGFSKSKNKSRSPRRGP
jgi:hypothetical protein